MTNTEKWKASGPPIIEAVEKWQAWARECVYSEDEIPRRASAIVERVAAALAEAAADGWEVGKIADFLIEEIIDREGREGMIDFDFAEQVIRLAQDCRERITAIRSTYGLPDPDTPKGDVVNRLIGEGWLREDAEDAADEQIREIIKGDVRGALTDGSPLERALTMALAWQPSEAGQRYLEARKEVFAAVAEALSSRAPQAADDWQLVPKEPTQEMRDAARFHVSFAREQPITFWEAMLAAAPVCVPQSGGEGRRKYRPSKDEIVEDAINSLREDLKQIAPADAPEGDVRGYCQHCDMEYDLHEDAQGFHHIVKGERVACIAALRRALWRGWFNEQ